MHSHPHGHSHRAETGRPNNRRALAAALGITVSIMLLEFIGGWWLRSLALISDAGHMLSDAGSLALSLLALLLAARPVSPGMTYGYSRVEVLAALLNGFTLMGVAGWVVWEAVERFRNPPEVAGGPMMAIAAIGLFANATSAWWLKRKGDVHGNLNVRSAYLHVIGDLLGSAGAIVAGFLMYAFSWYEADPLISVVTSALIARSAWGVLASAVRILMEGAPRTVSKRRVEEALRSLPNVVDVHDLHIWTIAPDFDALSCHLIVHEDADAQTVLREAARHVREAFCIDHVTFQVETAPCQTRVCQT
ncbi:cation diffusion facilitator family transporter [Hydrogenibacillus schlegelii]|uniref:Zinc transporter ZitB n=2 Tax=Hydrogenibacillus schlegelii TaxID=1484 RepID=A0A179IT96_HYDSH|nr:zinc transporter ZitB [Hydrogenibacillus schlegelii]